MPSLEKNPYSPPTANLEAPPRNDGGFFVVGIRKMLVLWLTTFGLYSVYWFYKNWQYVKETTGGGYPILGAIFNALSGFWLFKHISKAADDAGIESFNPNNSATLYFVANLLSRLPDPFWIIALIAIVPLVNIQKVVNQLNAGKPAEDMNTTLTGANWAVVVIGSLFWLLAIIALFLPDQPE